ncbi:SDR family NAD(P)-dependent oxidoreductase [Subtercola sp. YIM 133946]|uniref:SDR family NAD(P)-dependent oxidoreductase n=1 Tax=Subtercola sp. YIM 133946 TaxID=3118909 RepID=UPI002F94227D
MATSCIALVTGANQGVGYQVAKALAESGATVYLGSRDFDRGRAAAAEIGEGAIPLQIDITDAESIAAAAERIGAEQGRLDLLVNNAGISNTRRAAASTEQLADPAFFEEYTQAGLASRASLDEMRAVWDVNVFGTLAVYQAMLPLLRRGVDARIVNVSSGVGSLTANADPAYPYHSMFGVIYPASKAAENAVTLAIMIELENTDIKVNLVSPAFTATNLNNFAGTESVEDGSREVIRVVLLGPDGPSGTFTRWENAAIPW